MHGNRTVCIYPVGENALHSVEAPSNYVSVQLDLLFLNSKQNKFAHVNEGAAVLGSRYYVDWQACYLVKPGMIIALRESSRNIERFKNNLEDNSYHAIPKWLEFDAANMIGKVVAMPTREDIDLPIEEHLIVELYSK